MTTRWKPLTCPCVLEIEGEKWINTINKCSLHKEYTGQKLLNAVRRHNKENSPTEEPGFITFFISFDFEPDWLKSVAKVPSLEKISEANFNLESMSKYHPVDKEFQYSLSNFLSSSRSIFWYLLNEYSSKFGFEIGKYFTDEEYRKKRLGSMSSETEKFLKWYEKKYECFKKERSSFLIDKRDFNIHSGYVKQVFKLKQGPYRLHEDEINNNPEFPLDLNNVKPFFAEDENSTAIELCKEYLDNVEKLVKECHDKFPIN